MVNNEMLECGFPCKQRDEWGKNNDGKKGMEMSYTIPVFVLASFYLYS